MGQPDKGRVGPNSGNTLTGKVIRVWPTPNRADGERGPESRETKAARNAGGINLRQAIKEQDWFTPQGRDWKDTGPTQGNRKDVNLGVQVHQDQGDLYQCLGCFEKRKCTTHPASCPTCGSDQMENLMIRPTMGPHKGQEWNFEIGSWAGPPDQANPSTSGKSRDWSTPTRAEGRHDSGRRPGQTTQSLTVQSGSRPNVGSLNPRWVLQLMGYPADWLDGAETPSKP